MLYGSLKLCFVLLEQHRQKVDFFRFKNKDLCSVQKYMITFAEMGKVTSRQSYLSLMRIFLPKLAFSFIFFMLISLNYFVFDNQVFETGEYIVAKRSSVFSYQVIKMALNPYVGLFCLRSAWTVF